MLVRGAVAVVVVVVMVVVGLVVMAMEVRVTREWVIVESGIFFGLFQ